MTRVEPYYTGLGDRIRSARMKAGLSQGQVARRLGVTRANFANIECARQRALAHTIFEIAAILNVPVEEIVTDKVSEYEASSRWPTVEHELAEKLEISLERATEMLKVT